MRSPKPRPQNGGDERATKSRRTSMAYRLSSTKEQKHVGDTRVLHEQTQWIVPPGVAK
jgi:hypothetical protein